MAQNKAAAAKKDDKKAADKKKPTPPAQPARYARPEFTPYKTQQEAVDSIVNSATEISGLAEKFSKAPDSLTILNNAAKNLQERAAYITYRSGFVDKQADKAAKKADRDAKALAKAKADKEAADKRIADLEKTVPPAPKGK